MQSDKLKACPFCGAEPYTGANMVWCKTLGCPANHSTENKAAWNTRPVPDPEQQEGLRVALAKLVEQASEPEILSNAPDKVCEDCNSYGQDITGRGPAGSCCFSCQGDGVVKHPLVKALASAKAALTSPKAGELKYFPIGHPKGNQKGIDRG